MALPKVCGIETEYGIVVRGAENNPVSASSLLINAYVAATTDRRGGSRRLGLRRRAPGQRRPRLLRRRRAGAGGRDDARQRGADQRRPLLRRPRPPGDLDPGGHDGRRGGRVRPRRGGDRPAQHGPRLGQARRRLDGRRDRRAQEQLRRQGQQLRLPRELPAGAGDAVRTDRRPGDAALRHPPDLHAAPARSACELPGLPSDEVPFQLSQRADFFEEEVGLETTLKRPIVNTRDEPHCDPQKYRRLHVIVGDANMSEVATYLKIGTTAIVLAMIEDDALGDEWTLGNPVAAIRQVSHDPTLDPHRLLRDGRRATALEVQWGLVERARKYEHSHGLDSVGADVGRRRAVALGAGARRPRARSRLGRPLGRLGGQATPRRRLRRAPRRWRRGR